MPILYSIDEDRKLIQTTAIGVVTDDDAMGYIEALASDPRFRPGFRELADARPVTTQAVTSGGLWRMAVRAIRAARPVALRRVAIIAGDDETVGLARELKQLADGKSPRVRVFGDMAEARAWLGLDPDA